MVFFVFFQGETSSSLIFFSPFLQDYRDLTSQKKHWSFEDGHLKTRHNQTHCFLASSCCVYYIHSLTLMAELMQCWKNSLLFMPSIPLAGRLRGTGSRSSPELSNGNPTVAVGFKDFDFCPPKLGKWSNLTCAMCFSNVWLNQLETNTLLSSSFGESYNHQVYIVDVDFLNPSHLRGGSLANLGHFIPLHGHASNLEVFSQNIWQTWRFLIRWSWSFGLLKTPLGPPQQFRMVKRVQYLCYLHRIHGFLMVFWCIFSKTFRAIWGSEGLS